MSKHQGFLGKLWRTKIGYQTFSFFFEIVLRCFDYWAVLLNMSERVKRDEQFPESMSKTT